MTGSPNGMLFVATDVAAQDEADFNQWYDREHVEERVRVPGFLSGTRYQALQGGRKYLGLYKTESLASFTSAAYRAAFTQQTPWSVSSLDKMRDPMRRVCAVEAVTGQGCGSHLAIITLEQAEPEGLKLAILHLGNMLAEQPGFVRSSLLSPDAELSSPLPKESRENRRLLPMLLIESSSASAGLRLNELACRQLKTTADATQHYALGWQLTKQELTS
ncbi:antibiotic biosynthesis monooxygenase family protein [Serratia plymuthica]|jgi:hypothetical protein|uniref:antibiotic biosynthesis monooxygenase family protein n=1 Tax=Serratia plymuthica TaxID=82996 RepID=UPI0009377669|nr:DUF4286 family protein [Serratia plymuthica]OJT34333.1 hypothetical protein BSR04_25555 [Serratia plymuthica]